jgi:hypothetical protein
MNNPYPPATHYDARLMSIDDPRFGEVLNYARFGHETQDFRVLREHFSSPRLFDVYLQEFGHECWTAAGVSLLEQHTMLADNPEPTVAISLARWNSNLKGNVLELNAPKHGDKFVRVQIWSVDPTQLGFNRMAIGTLLSFTEGELYDPRLGMAVDEFARTLGFTNKD